MDVREKAINTALLDLMAINTDIDKALCLQNSVNLFMNAVMDLKSDSDISGFRTIQDNRKETYYQAWIVLDYLYKINDTISHIETNLYKSLYESELNDK